MSHPSSCAPLKSWFRKKTPALGAAALDRLKAPESSLLPHHPLQSVVKTAFPRAAFFHVLLCLLVSKQQTQFSSLDTYCSLALLPHCISCSYLTYRYSAFYSYSFSSTIFSLIFGIFCPFLVPVSHSPAKEATMKQSRHFHSIRMCELCQILTVPILTT